MMQTKENKCHDVIVIGGGMVGAAIAYGLSKKKNHVLVLDGCDTDYRAAKANFGLVWVQGKGYGVPAYQKLSHLSAQQWLAFSEELKEETGVTVDYENHGGLHFCVGEEEWHKRDARMTTWQSQAADSPHCVRMLDRAQLQALLPHARLGDAVTGASFGSADGHVNPLKLLFALQAALAAHEGVILNDTPATSIEPLPHSGFSVSTRNGRYETEKVVIAAGLGSACLGRKVGLDIPLHPQRGQLLVTERMQPLLGLPASGLRQTAEGTIMIGVTHEDAGYDLHTTSSAAARMAQRAIQILPDLAQARLVRQWACLRILTPDGCPIYCQSPSYPGAWVAVCHSGVTLAAFHARQLAECVHDSKLTPNLAFFHHERFNVPTTI